MKFIGIYKQKVEKTAFFRYLALTDNGEFYTLVNVDNKFALQKTHHRIDLGTCTELAIDEIMNGPDELLDMIHLAGLEEIIVNRIDNTIMTMNNTISKMTTLKDTILNKK